MPPTIYGWSDAFKLVDRSLRSAILAPKHFTGYRVPDPGMIIFSEIRRERNIFAWLVSRSANLRRLSITLESEDGVPVGVSNELWRVHIATDIAECDVRDSQHVDHPSTATFNGRAPAQQRRRAAESIFGRPPDKFNLQSATWRGHTIRWGTIFQHDALLVKEIMWDLHWSSFRFDLIALDLYLMKRRWASHRYERLDALSAVFGVYDAFIYEDGKVENSGIASSDAFERDRAYAAFASLMAPWPSPPNCSIPGSDRPSVERIAYRYCSTFAYNFGRPPVLPKYVPVADAYSGIIPYPAKRD